MKQENIFIDTSIFEANNFLESRMIKEYFRLSKEEKIKIILPELTFKEILNRAEKNCRESVKSFNNSRNSFKILRNIPEFEGKFNTIDKKECIEKILAEIKKEFEDSKIKIIDYPTVNVKSVFDSYFNKIPPFSEGLKKDEFPDAFALLSVEEWCDKHNQKCYILSNDKDLINYDGVNLVYTKFKDFLDKKLREIADEEKQSDMIVNMQNSFKVRERALCEQIENWASFQLSDESLYNDFVEFHGINEISIKHIFAEMDSTDYSIISINNQEIIIQSTFLLEFRVDINFNDGDSAYYDDDDQQWYYTQTETDKIVKHEEYPITLKYAIPVAGLEYAELEIDQINLGQDLKSI